MVEPRTSIAEFGAMPEEEGGVAPVGEGADEAEWDFGWGDPVPESSPETFQDLWKNRTFTVDEDTSGSLGMPGGGGGGQVAGGILGNLDEEQSQNARVIIKVAQRRGLGRYAQAVAIMTALGESGLRNLDYGDRDSIGMFQERSTYGSKSDRMDPWQTADRFFDRLTGVGGWQKMKPTMAAHRAQRNADPNHYTKWWNQAAGILSAAYGR